MKKYINHLAALLLATVLLTGCEKDEKKVSLTGSTPPVLTNTTLTTTRLLMVDSAKTAITFSWTNPNYMFTTGVSSQDVSYYLQIDTTGNNFKNAAQVAISKDLSITMNTKAFNNLFSLRDLLENVPHNVEIRIKATLANNSLPTYSNVVKMNITPYLDVAVPIPPTGELYITGDAFPPGWVNNPPASTQMFKKQSNTVYDITVALQAGKYYKFLSTQNNWQPQYGTTNANGTELEGTMGYNLGGGSDPAAISTPGIGGTYKITVNFKTGKYTLAKQ